MKINYEDWDEDFEDSSFVKLTKKAKIFLCASCGLYHFFLYEQS